MIQNVGVDDFLADTSVLSQASFTLKSTVQSTPRSSPFTPIYAPYEGQPVFMCLPGKLSLWQPLDGVAP